MHNLKAKLDTSRTKFGLGIIALLFIGGLWKVILLRSGAFPFNADEAIVGLMGRHILSGARPIFFYGQAYMGSLDAFLVALSFRIFGTELQVIRWVQIALSLGILYTTILIAYRLHKNQAAALLSGLLLAIPTLNFMLYTTVSLGGYGEALLIGNLLVLQTDRIRSAPVKPPHYFLWGMLAGLGYWAFGLTAVYILPGMLLVVAREKKRSRTNTFDWIVLLLGIITGMAPLLGWVMKNGLVVFLQEQFGSAIAGASPTSLIMSVWLHFQNFLLFGPSVIFGLRAPWSTQALSLPLMPFVIGFWGLVMLHTVLRRRKLAGSDALEHLMWASLLLLLGFLITPFGADPSGRYFLPVMIPLAILAGEFVSTPMISFPTSLRWILFTGVIAFHLHSTWQAATSLPDRITTQFDAVARVDQQGIDSLIAFLSDQGELRGYTNYWVAYPLAFRSDERLIFYPALPYHHDFRYTARYNRYPIYQDLVAQSPKVAYITTKHVDLDEHLRGSLEKQGVDWDEILIGEYRIFYNLSERVGIEEIDSFWLDPGN